MLGTQELIDIGVGISIFVTTLMIGGVLSSSVYRYELSDYTMSTPDYQSIGSMASDAARDSPSMVSAADEDENSSTHSRSSHTRSSVSNDE